MNKSDLISAIKEKTSLSRKDAEKVIDTFFDTITQSIVSGGRVEIRGFGSFMVKDYKPYVGRNPKTGSQIQVPPKKLPFFKVGKELKEMVDS
ncbi:MAG: Integration host factor beta subunit [Olavius algarvensis Delta 4 endosymbiont]|jgi:integration host factor subunit beta|nr:MAG: Integration host factor beta subunit [Olavius algarvensis Delta 4 endosymbiont]